MSTRHGLEPELPMGTLAYFTDLFAFTLLRSLLDIALKKTLWFIELVPCFSGRVKLILFSPQWRLHMVKREPDRIRSTRRSEPCKGQTAPAPRGPVSCPLCGHHCGNQLCLSSTGFQ